MSEPADPFWKTTPLGRMTRAQWESLCDGCAKCCLHKLKDSDSGEIHYTEVACRLLDLGTCQCTDYAQRARLVPECLTLTPENLAQAYWLPATCAYRRLAEGQALPDWHPLVSGDPRSTLCAGRSIAGRAIAEAEAGDWEEHLIDWVE